MPPLRPCASQKTHQTLTLSLLRPSTTTPQSHLNNNHHPQFQQFQQTQTRHATLLPRPKRPYTFTQLVTLSDGSTYTHRTSSPAPVHRSTKDARNVPLWNPSSQRLLNVEADEAGRLRAFRRRFGRGWDARRAVEEDEIEDEDVAEGVVGGAGVEGLVEGEEGGIEGVAGRVQDAERAVKKEVKRQRKTQREEEDNLLDLIAGFGAQEQRDQGEQGALKAGQEKGKKK